MKVAPYQDDCQKRLNNTTRYYKRIYIRIRSFDGDLCRATLLRDWAGCVPQQRCCWLAAVLAIINVLPILKFEWKTIIRITKRMEPERVYLSSLVVPTVYVQNPMTRTTRGRARLSARPPPGWIEPSKSGSLLQPTRKFFSANRIQFRILLPVPVPVPCLPLATPPPLEEEEG